MIGKLRAYPEVWLTAAMMAIVGVIAVLLGLPLQLPSGDRAAFVGINYLLPLVGVGVFGVFALFGLRRNLASTLLIALPCYTVMMLCYFTIKLWRPLINPTNWDRLYWQIDQALHPLVKACFWLRTSMAPIVPLDSKFYITAFMAMFYISFCFHALRALRGFRVMFLAALIFQGLGALSYLVMPALGPFLFESGVESTQSAAQQMMLGSYHELVAGGSDWLRSNGGTHLTVGLAAMPSLHTGGSFLFLLFAWRYARVLLPIYVPLFSFIVIDSIASRWHYLIDVPVGILLAIGSAWLAEQLVTRSTAADTAQAALSDNAVPPDLLPSVAH